MRAFPILALLLCSTLASAAIAAYDDYGSDESAASAASPEVSGSSSSSEEIIDSDQIEIIDGSGSGDEPISVKQINILGILPGPGDIRKKRSLFNTLLRK